MCNRVYECLLHAPTVSLGEGVYADCVLRVTERQQTDVSIVRPDPLAFLCTIVLMCNASQSTVTVLARP